MACPKGINCPKSNGPDVDFGSSAVLADLPGGKRILVAGQKSGVVTALDPDHGGEIVWQKRVGNGGANWAACNGASRPIRTTSMSPCPTLDSASWRPTAPGAQPFGSGQKSAFLMDSKAGGGLSALKLDTGEEVWRTPHPGCGDVPGCSPAQSAAVTAIPGLVFSGGLDGRLRAYSSARRPDRLGHGHERRLSDGQWRCGEGRLDRRRGSRRRRRHGLCRSGSGFVGTAPVTSCSHTLSTDCDRRVCSDIGRRPLPADCSWLQCRFAAIGRKKGVCQNFGCDPAHRHS